MILSLVLVEGESVRDDDLMAASLSNAKQRVVGAADGFGTVLHINATTVEDLESALAELSRVAGVTGLLTLGLRTSP